MGYIFCETFVRGRRGGSQRARLLPSAWKLMQDERTAGAQMTVREQ